MKQDDLIPIEELCRYYAVEHHFVLDLSDYKLLDLVHIEQALYLRKAQLNEFEMLCRLHFELDINIAGIDAIAHLLQKIKIMQSELNNLRLRTNQDVSGDYQDFLV